TALGTITDNNTVTIAVGNATVTEGSFGTVNAVFNVTLSAPSAQTITFDYATADGSATAPDDYVATNGTLTFTPGQTVRQVVVPVVGDTLIEVSETFGLNLTNPVNAIFSDATGLGTITDDDTRSITISSVTATEGNSGTQNFVFNVTLNAVSGSTVTVDYVTANGSATAPSDYIATSGTLTFAPGEVSKQIIVLVVGDTVAETNEVFSVNLTNAVNATIGGAGYGLGTINNND
ncbi:MAG: Calx-beta domain-containing protein, partial [Actinomycetota bacterium]